MSGRGGARTLTTVLFTDIVSSTDIATRLGDARWRELLSRHHSIVRRELKRYGGREVDTAGDGFFATFPAPADGVRCACAISEGVRSLGIEIRAGLHFGETEQMRPKVAGIAVVTASRIASIAGAGDVLVSSTIAELVDGSGISFADRGARELKGVAGEKRIFAVRALDGEARLPPLDRAEAAERLAQVEPPAMGHRVRIWIVVAAAAALLAVAAVVVVLMRGRGPTYVPGVNSIARIDPSSHSFDSPIAVGQSPTGLAFAGGSVWVTNQTDSTVERIDPSSGAVLATKSTLGVPTGIAAGDAGLFITTGYGVAGGKSQLLAIDLSSNEVSPACSTPGGPRALAVGAGAVWAANSDAGTLLRIDPAVGCSPQAIELGQGADPEVVAYGGSTSSVWAGDGTQPNVYRVSTEGEPAPASFGVGGPVSGIAVGSTSIWVTLGDSDEIARLGESGRGGVTDTIGLPADCDAPQGIAVGGDGDVWVGCYASGEVLEIDPGTNQVVATLHVNGSPAAVVADPASGDVWVSVHDA